MYGRQAGAALEMMQEHVKPYRCYSRPTKDMKVASDNRKRDDCKPGRRVQIVLKQDQRTGKTVAGIIGQVLTSSPYHSRGIKVRLTDGRVGRVAHFEEDDAAKNHSS
ncbi:Protein of unknown function DUF2196 [Desulfocurvibacter africanus subsp. africanus str. Walvis Bay]|uniref:YwbE family protein n=2 Tax=Desulfocurvibacter africanus TaxID=873 RepID=F3Z0I2_DESAF|nr:Protein of unknown function DUF2196 [Desulfocurvibacter africanus subsp. africanus str. Walvis Bay]